MIQNGQLLAVFDSAHRVMKAESVLKGSGITLLLIPAPRALSTDCGLAILYSNENYETVLQTLAAENILPRLIYRKDSDSDYATIWSASPGDEISLDTPSNISLKTNSS